VKIGQLVEGLERRYTHTNTPTGW